MKKVLKVIGIVLGIIILIPVAFLAYLRIVMYDPESTEELEFSSSTRTISAGTDLSVLSFNIGYAGYNKDEDFFMDGGKGVLPESKDAVLENLAGISSIITQEDCDIVFAQEVDIDSHRSYNINEAAYLKSSIGEDYSFACNYNVVFIPYPIPPIGKVNSGLATYTDLNVTEAVRYALPDTAPWYMSMGYLKRCLLVERIPVEGTDHELVIVNQHLEAYTDEVNRDMQMEVLCGLIEEEYEKGNYVLVGGDFNQAFAENNNPPLRSETGWLPGSISAEELPEGFSLAVSDNAPSCRSLEEPFTDNDTSQVYIIDGFIVSDNIEVESVEIHDHGFEYSDHNPVRLQIRLKP
ncbi:MAG: endonuclease [Lachnospiraceae bacterium]|nr:endonuclease [Lachnospiraceae bacterium]